MKTKPCLYRATALIAITAAVGVLSSCQSPDSKTTAEKKKDDAKVSKDTELYADPDAGTVTEEARKLNDAARLFAGLAALPGQDSHAKWRSQDFWNTYKLSADAMWKEFAAKRGKAVRQWSYSEASDLHDAQVVFQPFQGPNFVFAHLMMPASTTYVVCGSAPCADLPDADRMDLAAMADTIHALRNEVAASLETGLADATPSASPAGAVPMLMALVARTGHVIDGLEVLPPETDAEKKNTNQPDSACVVMMHDAEGRQKKLFYFQQDMSDQTLTAESAVMKFLEQQGKTVAVLRNTGHELHTPAYNQLREHLMKRGVTFVQDPSGMPFRSFDQSKWNVALYGAYSGAASDARQHEQPDLVAAYQAPDAGVGKLPFSAGDLAREMPAALIVARTSSEPVIDINVTPLVETSPPPTAEPPAALSGASPPPAASPQPAPEAAAPVVPLTNPVPPASATPATTASAAPLPATPPSASNFNLGPAPGTPIQITALEDLPREIKPTPAP